MERQKPEQKSSYEMGVDFYNRKIEEARAKLAEASTPFDVLQVVDQIELYELHIRQNERRQEVLVEGKPLFSQNGDQNLPLDKDKTSVIQ